MIDMTYENGEELRQDIKEIKRYLLGNGQPGLLDRMKRIEILQEQCPARNRLLTDEQALRIQKFAALISVGCMLIMILALIFNTGRAEDYDYTNKKVTVEQEQERVNNE
jgi:hypothetical protein